MPENLIYVPESNEEKAKKVLGERVVLALEIANASAKQYVEKVSKYEEAEPTEGLFIAIFEQVFAALS